MEKDVLRDFETFDEFPDKYLKVDERSNYYYIKIGGDCFVTKKKIETLSTIKALDNSKLIIVSKYYDVKNGDLVFTLGIIKDFQMNEKNCCGILNDVKIIPLKSILNIKGNDTYYLTENDIDVLTNFEKESEKVYKKRSGK